MKILITGANGFLGQHLTLYLSSKGYDVVASGRGNCKIPQLSNFEYQVLELTDEKNVKNIVSTVRPDFIVHTAAMSKPDECDRKRDECILNNVTATAYLVE